MKAAEATETAESESLKRQVVEARMAAMQAQVEPHFLFNTLASIDHLIETDPPRASQMQKNLIALLRASMPTMREATPAAHNLGREMAVIRPYLEILKVRMEDRLQTEIDVPDGLLSAEFPSMMIQTLVENAIKHGLEPKAEGGTLTVRPRSCTASSRSRSPTPAWASARRATAGTGVGLANIRERLQLLYGNKASMTVTENAPSGTVVTMTVPYQAQAREGEQRMTTHAEPRRWRSDAAGADRRSAGRARDRRGGRRPPGRRSPLDGDAHPGQSTARPGARCRRLSGWRRAALAVAARRARGAASAAMRRRRRCCRHRGR